MSFFPALLGPVVGGVTQILGQQSANKANEAAAQKQMDFQREMASTQYQRTVADMRAAGLNPMLATLSGSVDAAPSGAMSVSQNVAGAAGAVGDSINSALALPSIIQEKQAKADLDRSVAALNKEAGKKLITEQMLMKAQKKYTEALASGVSADNAQKMVVAQLYESLSPLDKRIFLGTKYFGEVLGHLMKWVPFVK